MAFTLRSMWASRFSLGIFQAGLTPLSAKILKDWIPLQNRGISSACIGACMSLGGAFTLWLTGWLLARDYGWRGIFNAYSLVGIVWAIGFYWFFRTDPEEHKSDPHSPKLQPHVRGARRLVHTAGRVNNQPYGNARRELGIPSPITCLTRTGRGSSQGS